MKNKGFTLQNFSKKNLGGLTHQNPAPYKEEAGLGGFSIIELLVTISVITILTGIVLVGYQSGKKQSALQRAANKLAQDIRRAEGMALASETCCASPAEVPEGGYGISPREGSPSYILYADKDDDRIYTTTGTDVAMETITIGENLEISGVSSGAVHVVADINFKPPDPVITIKNTDEAFDSLTITISFSGSPSPAKSITVNKAGLISISN